MNQIDKSKFVQKIQLVALRLQEVSLASFALKALQPHLLNKPRLRNIVVFNDEKVILLNEEIKSISEIQDSPGFNEFKKKCKVSSLPYTLVLDYDYFTFGEIIKILIPGLEVSAFETVGDIAHLNLREDVLPHKMVIGEVLLDKTKSINTVINKTGPVHTEFRTFPYEILATKIPQKHTLNSLETIHNDFGIRFHLDVAKVYYNSRLHTMHKDLIKNLPNDAIVADAMCGIGPFAIRAAKRGLECYANDLNPDSFFWLNKNIVKNKVKVSSYCMDAREFISKVKATDYIMNLPASSLTFLDAFYKHEKCRIHLFCFSSHQEEQKDVRNRIEAIFGCTVSVYESKFVRMVSTSKSCVYVKMELPNLVVSGKVEINHDAIKNEQKINKRIKI